MLVGFWQEVDIPSPSKGEGRVRFAFAPFNKGGKGDFFFVIPEQACLSGRQAGIQKHFAFALLLKEG